MSATSENQPRPELDEYAVGWISALPIEYAAAVAMLDEKHEPPDLQDNDSTLYTLGQICGHNVVIACLPAGLTGLASAASVATALSNRFPNVRIGLMVGIGGGVPSDDMDIRLGDVVVSQPKNGHGGVVQYDMGKRLPNGKFQHTSHLDKPPQLLLSALSQVQTNHILDECLFTSYLSKLEERTKFKRPTTDQLFQPDYQHRTGLNCTGCDANKLIERDPRSKDEAVQFHYGTIASANSLIKDGMQRDQICRDLGGDILCFETEAAGLMNNFPCLVIRGICDYADSHKNKRWQPYAAATAAAYAKETLSVIPPKKVADLNPIKAPWILPFNRNPCFTGRGSILQHLHNCLKDPEYNSYVAIHGLGGCGKSAVAVEFAYQARDTNPRCAVFWVSSFSVERFQESYREIARQLQIPGASDLEQDMLDPVRIKLSGEDQGQWLIIVDNVDDKNILYHTEADDHRLYDYLPHSRLGMIIFTTRSRQIAVDLAPNNARLLDNMESNEAKTLLYESLRGQEALNSEGNVEKFLEMLTYLPLAIIQAIAYIKKNGVSLQRYIDLFQETRSMSELLQMSFEDPTRSKESLNAVVRTWQISFQQIENEDILASKYLCFLACIAPQNIPRAIFPIPPSKVQQDKAIGTLTGYAFLNERKEAGSSYDMHILIHRVTQDWLKDTRRWTETARNTIKHLAQLIPSGGHKQSKIYPVYLSHGQFASKIGNIADEDASMELLDRVGQCYRFIGEHRHAAIAHQEVFERRKRLLGTEHPDTLKSQGRLASTYLSQGRWKEAEELKLHVLKTSIRVLGPEHRDTIASQSSLASIYRKQGRWKEAEELATHALEMSSRVLGPEHKKTLIIQGRLASEYRKEGRWKEAEELELQVLETSIRVLGPEHRDTITSQSSLASIYWKQGRWKEAEELDLHALEMRLRVLGPEHPATLTSQCNLASTYRRQGRWKEAEELGAQVFEMRLRINGPEHPDTLTSLSVIAMTLRCLNRLEEAEKKMETCVELSTKVLGSEHYITRRRLHRLESWRRLK